MKHFILLVVFTYSLCFSAQTENIIGDYEMKFEASNGLIRYKLTLNPDGTFAFHYFRFLKEALIKEDNFYAKGSWKSDHKLIYFSTDSEDFDEIHTLDFNNTKARYITKSSRDKSSRDIKTSIQIYESGISWLNRNKFIKVN